MKNLTRTLKDIFSVKELKEKILFTILCVIIFRLAASITVPGIDASSIMTNDILKIYGALTGGNIDQFSIVMMGLAPYINASIIMQLMTVLSPKLDRMYKEEGEEGRKKFNGYVRWLTLPLAFVQGFSMIAIIHIQNPNFIDIYDFTKIIPVLLTITAGTLFLLWLGEIITEKGIGNGTSIIIFAGIVSAVFPIIIKNLNSISSEYNLYPFIGFIILIIILLFLVVYFTESQRNIFITYAGSGKVSKGSLPIKLNQAGMIPIIFAMSVITFPTIIAKLTENSTTPMIKEISTWILNNIAGNNPSWIYILIDFLLIIGFTYFYVSITFRPDQIAENIQKRGGYITGLRPGQETAKYIELVSFRLTLWGGLFLGIISIIPIFYSKLSGLNQSDLIITGSGLIIIVGVVVEILRQINEKLVMQDYDKIK